MRATRQRRLGNGLMVMGLLAFLLGLLAGPASGGNDANFTDDGYAVTGSRAYDQGQNRTTFTFTLTGNSNPNYVLLISCPENQSVVSAVGPGNKDPDNAGQGEGHTGTKFTPGARGTYTIVFSGNVAGAEVVIKNGSGHRHFGAQGPGCTSSTTTTTAASTTTTTMAPTTTTLAPTTTTLAPATTTTEAPATTTTLAPTTTTTVDEPVGPREETTTSTTAAAATTTTQAPAAPATTTTGVANVGGTGGDQTTTTAPNPINQPAGDGTPLVPPGETAGTNQQRNNTLPVTGASTSAFLLLAGAALMLGGLAVRFAPPEVKEG